MAETITLTVRTPYASQLDIVRSVYAEARMRTRGMPATHPTVRYTCWSDVVRHLQWSITDDASKGLYSPDDLALWRKVKARQEVLANHPRVYAP